MPNNFKETTKNLKEIIDNLDKEREYEFHFHSADGADVTSRFGDVENIQYHNDEALTVTCIDGKKKGVASTNNLSDESIQLTIEKSKTIASFLETDKHQGLAKENLVNELAKQHGAITVLAYIDNKPAGLINCFQGFSTFKCKPLLNIHDVVVLKQYREQGVCQKMLNKVEALAKLMTWKYQS